MYQQNARVIDERDTSVRASPMYVIRPFATSPMRVSVGTPLELSYEQHVVACLSHLFEQPAVTKRTRTDEPLT